MTRKVLATVILGVLAWIPLQAAPARLAAEEAGEAQWIWYPESDLAKSPAATRYFRKTFTLAKPTSGEVVIACDNSYQLYVNGRMVGEGNKWEQLDRYDILSFLNEGQNVIAVKATNDTNDSPAGLVARIIVQSAGGPRVSFSTDGTWKASRLRYRGWYTLSLNDATWDDVAVLGEFGKTLPWKGRVGSSGGGGNGASGSSSAARFSVPSGFRVERVVRPEKTGSLVAMSFNERGHLIVSQENGPLMMITDSNGDYAPDEVSLYSDQVENCQGILCLNGQVFVTGEGPDGASFCRIRDDDADNKADRVDTLFKFKGGMSEHGPHAVLLGPEGLIYIAMGNHTSAELEYEPSSPYHHYYEGDLIQPRHEDPGGHAHQVRIPGGAVLRTDADGNFCEIFAGGLRNHYDMAFDRFGQLFTLDSDMEWDEGLPWYRPCRALHVTQGGDYGWRSGWAKFPNYYLDSLPAALDMGRGSPTGMVFYHHHKFPKKYHNSLIACDWTEGQILSLRFLPEAGSYTAEKEVLVQGRPLNVTDIEVGPDGWLYFITGGRGTEGGLYRLVYDSPPEAPPTGSGVMEAIRIPQLHSAWCRDRVARLKEQIGPEWDLDIVELARDKSLPIIDRCRALDLMQLVGPFPETSMLAELGKDPSQEIRQKAAYLMGIHIDDITEDALIELARDPDPVVRRQALESLVRAHRPPPLDLIFERMNEDHRFIRWAAMRALQLVPVDQWRDEVITSANVKVFTMGAVAMLGVAPERKNCVDVLNRYRGYARTFVPDSDFVDLLRVLQLSIYRGGFRAEQLGPLSKELVMEFPAGDMRMNHELIRLLAHVQEGSVIPRCLEMLNNKDWTLSDRIHLAMHLHHFTEGWAGEQKLDVLQFFEDARADNGGASYARYIDYGARDFMKLLSDEEQQRILAQGDAMPAMALQVVKGLPTDMDDTRIRQLITLDQQISEKRDRSSSDLKTGIVAILGRTKNDTALTYLRQIFLEQPERRQDVAMIISTQPTDNKEENIKNWPLMVRAIPVLEDLAATMVLKSLAEIPFRPKKSEPIRQVLLSGLQLDDEGALAAIEVVKLWSGEDVSDPGDSARDQLAAWQNWFTSKYPQSPPAELPVAGKNTRWSFDEVYDYLQSPDGSTGDAMRGAAIFAKEGQCKKCHRFGGAGEPVGPDLTSIGKRFQRKEILESLIYPSHVISDQYASQSVLTTNGITYTGILGHETSGEIVILQSDGKKVTLKESEVEEVAPVTKSAMPEGLLDELTLQEIADLFEYLTHPPGR
ncbi:Cytochrome c domain-containing protein [Planctomycetales bacterium 10988]|nr:Cytochrome c domain-containing protein [Planctomycetales bacterium 10988]